MKDPVFEIKQRIDITDLIGSYLPLKKAGRNYRAPCPFHSEKTPSFMVSPELQIYKCYGCGEGGDIYSFVQKIEGIDFTSALEQLAEKAGVKLEKRNIDPQSQLKKQIYFINSLTAEFYHRILLNNKAGKQALAYLKKDRKLTTQTIKDFKIGYAPQTWDLLYRFLSKKEISAQDMLAAGVVNKKRDGNGFIDKFRGRVVFPLTGIDGKVVGFTGRTMFDKEPKYLNTAETPVFYKTSFLYGLDKARIVLKNEGVIFVEGQMDVIKANQEGIQNVVASSGTALTESQLKILSRYTKDLNFCFDPDTAGVTAMHRAIELAENQDFNIKVIAISDEYDDLDDLLTKDKRLAKKTILKPVPIYDFFIASALKKYDKKSPHDKKKIVQELAPKFSFIKNTVLIDHYTSELSKELDLAQETVASIFFEKAQKMTKEQLSRIGSKFTTTICQENTVADSYVISLLLKADIDKVRENAYKLEVEDFIDTTTREIFETLTNLLASEKGDINIKKFADDLKEELKETFEYLYLFDLGKLAEEPELLEKEIGDVVSRMKKKRVKADMKKLSEQIKLAEKENDVKEIEKLSKKFDKLSKKL